MNGQPRIGFIGQGWIGKHYADDYEARGYEVVRYGLEPQYIGNKDAIADCDIILIAVPTPSTPDGYSFAIVESALSLIGAGKIAVVKSTLLPGTTKLLQEKYPHIIVLHSPEFLSEATASYDVAHPFSNIVGMPVKDAAHEEAAAQVHATFPEAPQSFTVGSTEAELIKYSHNGSGYVQIVFFNLMYDLAQSLGAEWKDIEPAVLTDPLICNRYAKPLHKSGRGAGGHCFIKDFAALKEAYTKARPADTAGKAAFDGLEAKNLELLRESGKDADLVEGVYGKR